MQFASLMYFAFLAIAFAIHRLVRGSRRGTALLICSAMFVISIASILSTVALAAATMITYTVGLRLGTEAVQTRRTAFLSIGIFFNIAALVFLKYLSSPVESTVTREIIASPLVRNLGAIGVSYYVIQAIGYLLDVYWEFAESERNVGRLALFLFFFPKFVQGPIERFGPFLSQEEGRELPDYNTIRYGLLLIGLGLFKKFVVADRLAVFVDGVYGNIQQQNALRITIATYVYYFQLYFDFSGYTDMALGSGRLFNISLTNNFDNPYFARSVTDFWRRWHISLSRWILDYIFKPLQFHLRGFKTTGTLIALLVTFIICGIWHGATGVFIVWGILHGIYMSCSFLYAPMKARMYGRIGEKAPRITAAWQSFITYNLVSFSWIFFRAKSLDDALFAVNTLAAGALNLVCASSSFTNLRYLVNTYNEILYSFHLESILIFFCIIVISTLLISLLIKSNNIADYVIDRPIYIRWPFYMILLFSILLLGNFQNKSFVYMNF